MSIKFVDMVESLLKERRRSIIKCERSVITITFFQLDYLLHTFDNCTDDIFTKTNLILKFIEWLYDGFYSRWSDYSNQIDYLSASTVSREHSCNKHDHA